METDGFRDPVFGFNNSWEIINHWGGTLSVHYTVRLDVDTKATLPPRKAYEGGIDWS